LHSFPTRRSSDLGLFVDVQVRDADPAGESLEPFEGTGGVYEPYAVSLCGAGHDAPAVHVLFGGGALVGGLEFVDGPHECCLLPSVLWPSHRPPSASLVCPSPCGPALRAT